MSASSDKSSWLILRVARHCRSSAPNWLTSAAVPAEWVVPRIAISIVTTCGLASITSEVIAPRFPVRTIRLAVRIRGKNFMQRRQFMKLTSGAFALAVTSPNIRARKAEIAPESSGRLGAEDFHTSRKFVATPQGRIAYMDRGRGPAALFLHGFPLNSFQWRGAIPLLAEHRRCIAPDYLGLGFTEPADGQSVALSDQTAMLIALLDKLSIHTVDIVANDSGGAIAQLMMVHHTHRVRTVLLTNCDTEPDSPPPSMLPLIGLAKSGDFADKILAPWLADKELARSPKGLGGLCYANSAHPTDEALDYYLQPLLAFTSSKQRVNQYVVDLEKNPLAGIASALKSSKIPVRILWGTADRIFSQDSAGYLDRTVGHSLGVRRIEGAKLFFPEEMPELIAEEARKLWRV
jgi:haloalkane dehalogenase